MTEINKDCPVCPYCGKWCYNLYKTDGVYCCNRCSEDFEIVSKIVFYTFRIEEGKELKGEDLEKINITKEVLKENIEILSDSFDKELFLKSKEELEEYWNFSFDFENNDVLIFYKFYRALKLYENFCRRWENYNSGYVCVVERVRENYLMPKIKMFMERLNEVNK
jgi:hypothetical protein